MKRIVILGSTGSIGTQSIEVAKKYNFEVVGLSANSNADLLASQALDLGVKYVCIGDTAKEDYLKSLLQNTDITVLSGEEGLCSLAVIPESDMVLNSVVGMVGLKPTLAAIKAKKDIALANKETLVVGGALVMSEAKKQGVNIYPVDSEHSAIFQCLQNGDKYLKKILLTASGGPFFGFSKEELKNVTKAQALKHPNWEMGAKITTDSATLMNKGLEFIEAMWLFDVTPEQIEIIIHRQSVIHSLVEFDDSSVIGQLGVPDMKIPIQYALTYPDRFECDVKPLSLTDYGTLTFYKPDFKVFDCLDACITATKMGGTMCAIVNGANEAAVALFLEDKIDFYQIGEVVKASLSLDFEKQVTDVEQVINADKKAREFVTNYFAK